jgi:hypothetical protein
MSNYYLGNSPADILGTNPRYFYAIRKNENGSLFLEKNDQLLDTDSIAVNEIGPLEENYNDFEVGIDFFEGVNANHEKVFGNLKYPQYRWDNKSVIYYINEEGELVARINQDYTHLQGLSED